MGKSNSPDKSITALRHKSGSPGPGHYDNYHKSIGKDSQMASIKGRPRELSDSNSPGPGYYEAKHEAVKDRVVSYDMGKASKKETFTQFKDSSMSPGPGHYDADYKNIGKDSQMASIRERPRDQSNNDSPGPGYYKANHNAIKDKVVTYDMGRASSKVSYME